MTVFNYDKQLREVTYEFRSSSYRDTIDSDYKSVNDGLVRKYGSPLGYSNGQCYIITSKSLEGAVLVTELYEAMGKYGGMRDYDEWDVVFDGYHVKIDHYEYYAGLTYSEINNSHSLCYKYFTDEDLGAALNEKQEQRDSVDNDI